MTGERDQATNHCRERADSGSACVKVQVPEQNRPLSLPPRIAGRRRQPWEINVTSSDVASSKNRA